MNKIRIKFFLTILLFIQSTSYVMTKHIYPEKEYQTQWCKKHNGKTEYRLQDNTRIDCLTEEYAIEFDFAHKWAEAIGQTLYYSLITSKHAGIVLIIENKEKETNHYKRLKALADKYNIKLWTITPQDICTTENYK